MYVCIYTHTHNTHISSTFKVGQKLGVSLPLLTCSPSVWPSRLLYRRGRKPQRDLNELPYVRARARACIYIYIYTHTHTHTARVIYIYTHTFLDHVRRVLTGSPSFVGHVRCVCVHTHTQGNSFKSLRDFRPLRFSSRDGHTEGEHVNRGRETLQVSVLPWRCSICPTLVTQQMSILQITRQRFLIPCPRHVSSRPPPSGETCKYAMTPSI